MLQRYRWPALITVSVLSFTLILNLPAEPEFTAASTPFESASSQQEALQATELRVEVSGAVRTPGVYALPAGSRLIDAITAAGGEVIHAASLVDRSNGKADLGVPFTPLIRLDVPSYQPDALPPELEAIPAIKPGSRAA